jgi:uroporphyrinogen decarboxylase
MSSHTMTPLERWRSVLEGKNPDRIPLDYWATSETTDKLLRHFGCRSEREMLKKMHVDFVITLKPEYKGPALCADRDVFGCLYKSVKYRGGMYSECVFHPLAAMRSVKEIEQEFTWPSPDWWDYSILSSQISGWEDYPVKGGHCEPFLIYKYLRGEEQAFMDLIKHPDIVHHCLDRLFHLAHEEIRRIHEHLPGQVLMTYVAEDMGGQDDLLISPLHIREYLLPRMKKIIDLVHRSGAYVFHHNDGAIRRILPDLIDLGIDILNPVQWRCSGMGRRALIKDFGCRIAFHGGMDNQQTLPFGTVRDVENEVLENLEILGKAGRYILAPCHNIQANTPVENIIAMYETAHKNGAL